MKSISENLREMLHNGENSAQLFDRLAVEYRTAGEAGKQELFLAVVAEMATAQVVIRAVVGPRRMDSSLSTEI